VLFDPLTQLPDVGIRSKLVVTRRAESVAQLCVRQPLKLQADPLGMCYRNAFPFSKRCLPIVSPQSPAVETELMRQVQTAFHRTTPALLPNNRLLDVRSIVRKAVH
jgi:hypothetical protein